MNRIVLCCLLLISTVAHAADEIASYSSAPGETVDSLVLRVAPSLRLMTKAKNAEICGTIVADGEVWKLRILAIGSNHQCFVEAADDAVLFHTHTEYFGHRFSRADYSKPGYMIRGQRVCWQNGEGTEALVTKYGRRGGSSCAATN